WPSARVTSTRPLCVSPAHQEFVERDSYPSSPTVHSASRSTRQRLARDPGARVNGSIPNGGPPEPSFSTSRERVILPVLTRCVYSEENAVSRPVTPMFAAS